MDKLKRIRAASYRFLFLAMVFLVASLPACAPVTGEIKSELGQQFSLAIGQTAAITNENLTIRFDEIIEDSRCPAGVVCVWEGRVSAVVIVTDNGSSAKTVLTEPGLTDESAGTRYQNYQFSFHVEPYPKAGEKIADSDYRLLLTVSKLTNS